MRTRWATTIRIWPRAAFAAVAVAVAVDGDRSGRSCMMRASSVAAAAAADVP